MFFRTSGSVSQKILTVLFKRSLDFVQLAAMHLFSSYRSDLTYSYHKKRQKGFIRRFKTSFWSCTL